MIKDGLLLGNKTSLSKFKKIQTIPSMFSDQNAMRLEIKYKEKTAENTNMWRLNNMLLNKHGSPKKSRNKKIPGDKWKRKHNDPKSLGCSKISSKGEVFSNTSLPQGTRTISNKQPTLTPKGNRERRTHKTQS